jgi:hypothetical protein
MRMPEYLKIAQNENLLTNSYLLSIFKNCLSSRYRLFADDLVGAEKLDNLV